MSSQDDLTKTAVQGTEETKSPGEKTAQAVNAPPVDALEVQDEGVPQQKEQDPASEDLSMPLLPKMLRTTRLLLSSKSFFYSPEYDLSHSFAKQPNTGSAAPLFKQFDALVRKCIICWSYQC